jgi:hypothetical protein
LIRIADFTKHLERAARDEEANREFDRICGWLFGATLGDISDADYARFQAPQDLAHKITVEHCRELGYDLITRDGVPVRDWESFAKLIVAKAEGLLPKKPAKRAEGRPSGDEEGFAADKADGAIKDK